jgi:2-polyprenyl-6-methoxyphenol hydroxylase-like FAD-dependent oxidoreductase
MAGPPSSDGHSGRSAAADHLGSSSAARPPDRQILVVGDGLAAAATAGFLGQAGFDPVLASSSSERTRSPLVTLWEPGLALLERIGLRRPVERLGTPLYSLACHTADRTWTRDGDARPSLVALRRSRLRSLLDRQLRGRLRTAERPVTDVEPIADGVSATFESGIHEPFDTVVTTDRSLLRARETTSNARSVHTWAFEWPDEPSSPDAPSEAWDDALAAFTVPVADGTRARLVAGAETAPVTAVSVDELGGRFGHLFAATDDPFDALDHHTLRYRRVPLVVPASMRPGRVALVGPAARTMLPGNPLRAALGVEDAWVLADTLAYGPPDIDAALDAYERRRRRRSTELLPDCLDAAATRADASLRPPLRRLCAARTLAFSHVVDGRVPDLARAVPESL